jgi:hypothetical protein
VLDTHVRNALLYVDTLAGELPFDLRRAGRIVISLADGAPGMDVAADPVAARNITNWAKAMKIVAGGKDGEGLCPTRADAELLAATG